MTETAKPCLMFDAVDIAHLPPEATMVAGYVDGRWPTFAHLKARFPKAQRVSIATSDAHRADVLDVEKGDAHPGDVPAWCNWMRHEGRDPIVYSSRDVWPLVLRSCVAVKVTPPKWWAADWTGERHDVEGAIATQFASPTVPWDNGYPNADTSSVTTAWPPPFTTQEKGTTVKLPLPTKAQLVALVHELAGLGAIVTSIANTFTLPASVRAALVAIGGALVGAERVGTKLGG